VTSTLAVTFEEGGQLHYLNAAGESYSVGDAVLYPTPSGPEVAHVVWVSSDDTSVTETLPHCLGPAEPDDIERDNENRAKRAWAFDIAKNLTAQRIPDMKIVAIDWIDRDPAADQLAAIYFQAPGRVDFRALVGELARALQARVDLRQVGGRDATRLCGGLGTCGRPLCCCTWMTTFEPISLRLAKVQDLSGNPSAISGACGRLKCCLRFEQLAYRDFIRRAPETGTSVITEQGVGKIIGHRVPSEEVTVRLRDGQVCDCPLASVTRVPMAQRVTQPLVTAASSAASSVSAATTQMVDAATSVFKPRPGTAARTTPSDSLPIDPASDTVTPPDSGRVEDETTQIGHEEG
jgi:cell fate regulator YaaT (PSP1 superfamily)